MCGIAGFMESRSRDRGQARAIAGAMTAAIRHRGPDGDGHWIDPEGRVALGHRRLAIIDLSETGAQPMRSESGRFEIVYNGEIYGFAALRADLERQGAVFRGHSDTEALLAGIERYGVEKTLHKANGMFAFAVFDRQTRRVILARDRLGKKPLYVGVSGGSLCFASELKALRAHPAFAAPTTDRRARALYLRYGYVPAPHSIYEGVIKMPPGHWVELSVDAPPRGVQDVLDTAKRFWSFDAAVERGRSEPITDPREALERLDALLSRATAERLVSDVPVGAFLSGGIDSSLITAMMCEQASRTVSTYTIRFDDEDVNEADAAAKTAAFLGTAHTEMTATAADALALVPEMPDVFDEPLGDPSQLPTLLVSRLIRSEVTVALSGDGGDESFGGYNRYWAAQKLDKYLRYLPGGAFGAIQRFPDRHMERAVALAGAALPGRIGRQISSDRLKKLATIAAAPSFRARYDRSFTMWSDADLNADARLGASGPFETQDVSGLRSKVDQMMALDTAIYLPDDVLVKVDRASMAASLEVRSPLLDYNVVEFAWAMPRDLTLNAGVGKVALRKLLERRLPKELYDRPKKGFGIPVDAWIRGPLRDMVGDAVSPDSLARIGVLDPDCAVKKFSEHMAGSRNWGRHLWALTMLSTWQSRWE
ncbi:asparagine synthase (glutamine-hydrolyzing) [Palleronia rufa]|uniref:asparagine synthase (glutamine-hydrolyzing) n=1 Tax=Palleronia rufa TaxID=1530186 RepID=UPI00055C5353|nr:asparagine synthase (glutamine-hydrolyzing) [Palleronia rufa]